MTGIYGISEETESQLSQLVASDVHEIKEITMKANCGDLSRGTVLEMTSTANSTWQELATAANARAILAEDVTNDASNTQKAQAYFIGKYVETDLIWPSAITTANKKTAIVALQDRGILIDEAILDVSTTTTTTTTTTSSSTTTTTTATSA
jgi:hypothetical protein